MDLKLSSPRGAHSPVAPRGVRGVDIGDNNSVGLTSEAVCFIFFRPKLSSSCLLPLGAGVVRDQCFLYESDQNCFEMFSVMVLKRLFL